MEQKALPAPSEREGFPFLSPAAQRVFDHLPLGLLFVIRERVAFVNQALGNLLGRGCGPLTGQSYHRVFKRLADRSRAPQKNLRSLQAALLKLSENPRVQLTFSAGQPEGAELTFFVVRDVDGDAVGWGAVVGELPAESAADQQRSRLLSRIASDIRKNLAGIQGQWRTLTEHYQTWDQTLVQDFSESLYGQFQGAVNQFDQVMDLLTFQQEGLVLYPEEVHLQPMLEEMVDNLGLRYPLHEFQLAFESDLPALRVDPQWVRETFRVCVGFLAEGMQAGSSLEIKAAGRGNWVEIALQTEGVEESLPRQESFFAPEQEDQGLVSGELLIAHTIVEEHGGRMRLERPDSGGQNTLRIVFTLPIMPVQRRIRMRDDRSVSQKDMTGTVVVADQDSDSLTLLTSAFDEAGYQVRVASDGPSVIDVVQAETPDLVILSWELPTMSGLNVCRYLRRWTSVPIFMITSKTNPEHCIEAFEAGVDDFLTKPFLMEEVLWRARALIRRGDVDDPVGKEDVFEDKGLRIHFDAQRVWVEGQQIELTPTEYTLLTYMVRHRRRILPYQQLIEHAWDGPDKGTRRGLFVHISRLRDKIEPDPEQPQFIVTRWGVGYVFLPQ